MSSVARSPGTIRFGLFELDLRSGELRRQGRSSRLQDKPLQLLSLLLERPSELLTREEIGERIWGSSRYFDFEDSLNQAMRKLRDALGDSAANPRFIETIPRRGYRFIAPVEGAAVPAPAAFRTQRITPDRRITVGRRRELDALRTAFEDAARGRGRVICVTGEPGIGKTTLIEEFLLELAAGGREFHSARGRCSERLAGEEAYLPLLEALECLIDANGLESLMKRVAPSWYAQVAAPESLDPSMTAEARGATQERRKRDLLAFVQEAARALPLLICLDDLHWADVSTVDALYFLAMRCENARVLVVVTYRPSELTLSDHSFRQAQLELESRGLCKQVPIGFLTREDTERYLTLQFPGNRFPPELSESIHARTEGSPLFMVGLLDDLKEHGSIRMGETGWELDSAALAGPVELPRSISAMIQRKIEKLSEDDRRLLCSASLQGQEFEAAIAAEVSSMTEAEAERRLAALAETHALIRLSGERAYPDRSVTTRFSFVHALYQNAFYASLTPTWRAAQSAAAADALVRRYGERSASVAADLAHLYEAARQPALASEYFLLAARGAAAVAANREAEALARRALKNAGDLPSDQRTKRNIEAFLFLGEVCENSGRHEPAVAAFESAETAAAEVGDATSQVDAACGRANALFWLKRLPEMRDHAARAIDIASAARDHRGVAMAQAISARERLCVGDLASAEAQFDQARPVLESPGVTGQALDAAVFRVLLHTHRLEFDEAERISRWWLERARSAGLPAIKHNFFFGMALGNHGRLGEAIATLREGIRIAELNDDYFCACRIYNTLGWLYQDLGDPQAAVDLFEYGARLSAELRNEEAQFSSLVNLAAAFREEGELGRALETLEASRRICDRDVWFRWRFKMRWQVEAAAYRFAKEDFAGAAAHARETFALAEPLLCRKYMAWAHKFLGDIAVREDRVEAARAEYNTALAFIHPNRCPMLEWKTLLPLAGVLEALRMRPEADDARARARSIVQSLGDSIADDKLRRAFVSRSRNAGL